MVTTLLAGHRIFSEQVTSPIIFATFSFLLVRPTVEKLLLIADPQLIGEKDEGVFGAITRVDADRSDFSIETPFHHQNSLPDI